MESYCRNVRSGKRLLTLRRAPLILQPWKLKQQLQEKARTGAQGQTSRAEMLRRLKPRMLSCRSVGTGEHSILNSVFPHGCGA